MSKKIKSLMSPKKKKGFTEADKKRIMSAESKKHGKIREDSFASDVQKRVDKEKSK
jgi:hypothetical protein